MMNARDAAYAAGWMEWFGYWISTNIEAIMHHEHPPYWDGTAKDLCLAYGIKFNEFPD